MNEIWKDILGYEGLYQVSNLGRVRSLDKRRWNGRTWCIKKGRVLRSCDNGVGYLVVNLKDEGVQHMQLVHRLVAKTFINNPEQLKYVNHKDLNKRNNEVTNLEWCTAKQNVHHARRNGHLPTYYKKRVLCVELNREFESVAAAEKWLGLKGNRIANVCKLKRGCKTCGGYHWRYIV